MRSLLRLCLLEPELRWHFIYINNYWPESPLGLPWSNQTSNALKIAHHLLLMGNYKMHCYSCTLTLLILMKIMSILNRLNRLYILIQRCVSIVICFERFFIKRNLCVFLAELCRVLTCAYTVLNEHAWQWLPVSAINCFWANLICSSRTPSVPELYKRRIKDASRVKKKQEWKGLRSLEHLRAVSPLCQ